MPAPKARPVKVQCSGAVSVTAVEEATVEATALLFSPGAADLVAAAAPGVPPAVVWVWSMGDTFGWEVSDVPLRLSPVLLANNF